jgi:hypothetical protein
VRNVGEIIKFPRSKLVVDQVTGKVTGQPQFRNPEAANFAERMLRIKQSLEKINALMEEFQKNKEEKRCR